MGKGQLRNDRLNAEVLGTNEVFGDEMNLFSSRGGNDYITSGNIGGATLVGDSGTIGALAFGGNDTIETATSGNSLYGDAFPELAGRGGNDRLSSFGGDDNVLYGDALTMIGDSQGGNDILTVTGGSGNVLYGDAYELRDNAAGGNDTLNGGTGNDVLYGDSLVASATSSGGNDILNGGEGDDTMYGGGGNDILNGGTGNDTMAGGDGRDDFVFEQGSGEDTILDFVIGEDEIDLSNYFADGQTPSWDVSPSGNDTVITLQGGDSITLVDVLADDFDGSGSVIV